MSTKINSASSISNDSAKGTDFSLVCIRNYDGSITDLKINNKSLVKDNKISNVFSYSAPIFKETLEGIIKDNFDTFPVDQKFKIISKNNDLKLQKKNPEYGTNSVFRSITDSAHITNPKTEKTTSPVDKKIANKIVDINNDFQKNNSLIDKISKKTNVHNIAQLIAKPKANKTVVKLLLTALTIGLLAGIIGIGGVLPSFGIPYLTTLAIPGIPLPIALGLLGAGALTTASFAALNIASKKIDTAKEYLNAIMLLKSHLFLESNLNDVTNTILFILMTLTMVHAPWFGTLQGCFAYPTGALLLFSGLYQLGESIKSTINNRKIKDNKEMIISILNVLCSSTVIAMGALTMIGLINSPITVGVMLAFGALMVTVNAYSLYKSFDQYKEINKVDKENPTAILNFLKNKLSLNNDEIKELKAKIDKMEPKDFIKWITKNNKNFAEEQAKIFQIMKEQLISAEENKENDKIMQIVKDMKKIMLIEEIKNATESKIERFGSIVSKDTLLDTLENFDKFKKDLDGNNDKIKTLFATIKKETKRKTMAEAFKFAVINVPIMIFPFLKMFSLINLVAYDLLMAAELLANISVNITPRYRNIPPAMIKEVSDINAALKTDEYLKYKNLLPKAGDKTSTKTEQVFAAKTEEIVDKIAV